MIFPNGRYRADAFMGLIQDLRQAKKQRAEIRHLSETGQVHPLSQLPLARKKTSDTLFILGSGSSVADLTPDDFAYIRTHDSLGLNFWLIHEFVPTWHMMEPSHHLARNEVMHRLLKRKAEQLRDVPLIMQYRLCKQLGIGLDMVPRELHDNLYLHAPWSLATTDPNQLGHWLRNWKWAHRLGLADLDRLVHHRASLNLAVLFAACCGYRRIVLIGVDLNTTDYFWERNADRYAHCPQPGNVEKGAVHMTADPKLTPQSGALPVTEYLPLLNQVLLKPRGIQLLAANPRSRLIDLGFAVETRLPSNTPKH